MTRTPLRAALVVAALAAGLSACSPEPETSADGVPSGSVSAGGASPGTAGAVYVTGAKTGDDPCTRVVSAIGYLGLSLLPAGREEAQHWDGDVRGRFGYLRGTLAMYGSRLPGPASDAATAIDDVAETLSRADTAHSRRPDLLRRYRTASAAVLAACGQT